MFDLFVLPGKLAQCRGTCEVPETCLLNNRSEEQGRESLQEFLQLFGAYVATFCRLGKLSPEMNPDRPYSKKNAEIAIMYTNFTHSTFNCTLPYTLLPALKAGGYQSQGWDWLGLAVRMTRKHSQETGDGPRHCPGATQMGLDPEFQVVLAMLSEARTNTRSSHHFLFFYREEYGNINAPTQRASSLSKPQIRNKKQAKGLWAAKIVVTKFTHYQRRGCRPH